MSSTGIWEDFAALPIEAQQQVADFVAFLRTRHVRSHVEGKIKRGALVSESFIGVWRDRRDMDDSSQWVRDMRQREWN